MATSSIGQGLAWRAEVGRTITNREGVDLIVTPHIARALQHRKREGE